MFKNWPMWWKVLAAIGGAIVGIAGIVSAYFTVRAYYYPPNPPAQNNAKTNPKNEGTNLTNNDPIKRNSNNSIHYQKSSMEVAQFADKKAAPPSHKIYSAHPKVNPINADSANQSLKIEEKSNIPSMKSTESSPIIHKKTIIKISGTSNNLILKDSSNTPYFEYLKISGSDTTNTIYIPKGQHVHIILSGTDNNIKVVGSLIEFITVDDSGVGNSLHE